MPYRKHSSNQQSVSYFYYLWILFLISLRKLKGRVSSFRSRRYHKSFRLTKRRDYIRQTELPGYFKFNGIVFGLISKNWLIFLKIVALFSSISIILIGLMGQDFLNEVWDLLDKTNKSAGDVFSGALGEAGKAGLILLSAASTGGLAPSLNENQVLVLVIMLLLMFLVILQVCRNLLLGNRDIKLRDVLYSAGAPIVNLAIIVLLILVQALPIMIAIIVWSAAKLTNLFEIGVEQMMFSLGGLLLVCISVYWIVGSIFALIISTVSQAGRPVYPMQAIRIAGDMMSSRRLIVLKRILWMILTVGVVWLVIFIPTILGLRFLGDKIDLIKNLPILQVLIVLMTSLSVVYFTSYLYILYRKIIENDQN